MKTRNGFVSNSSSTSFLVITTAKTLDEVLNKFEPKQRKFLDKVLSFEEMTLKGSKYLIFNQTWDSESLSETYDEVTGEEDSDGQSSEILYDFLDAFDGEKDSYTSRGSC